MADLRRGSASDEEGEALILHRLSSDRLGRPYVSSIPTTSGTSSSTHYGNRDDQNHQEDDDDDDEIGDMERGFAPRKGGQARMRGSGPTASQVADDLLLTPVPTDNADDKLGRPAWLRRTSRLSARSGRLRICLLCLCGIVAAATFTLAFAPGLGSTRSRIKDLVQKTWRGSTGSTRGTDWYRGYPGTTLTGAAPNWASEAHTPLGWNTAIAPAPTRGSAPMQTAVAGFEKGSFDPFRHMGALTPYVASTGHGVDANYRDLTSLEGGSCELDQVHILHRVSRTRACAR